MGTSLTLWHDARRHRRKDIGYRADASVQQYTPAGGLLDTANRLE
jgi:hypothetical protein